MAIPVQKFNFVSRGGYVCYPKVMDNNGITWDARSIDGWSHWTLDIDQSEVVDLFDDAKLQEGDLVWAGIDVVAGFDASCPKIFVVTRNGKTASFDAEGITTKTALNYTGSN